MSCCVCCVPVCVLVEQSPLRPPLLLLALPLVQLLSLPRPPGARSRDLTLTNQKTAHHLLQSVEKCISPRWEKVEEVSTVYRAMNIGWRDCK